MVHIIFDTKCLHVYFTLSQDNFIFGDVISMWEMSFVFKNGCIYECWMSNRIWWFLKIKNFTAIFKVARYFSARCVRRLEEHTKNTGNKVERSLVPFHIRSQMTQMHWCYSKCVCVSLGRHPHLIIFRILDLVSSLAIILLGMGSRLYYSFGFLFVNPVLYTSVEEHNSKLCPCSILRSTPVLHFPSYQHKHAFITHLCL